MQYTLIIIICLLFTDPILIRGQKLDSILNEVPAPYHQPLVEAIEEERRRATSYFLIMLTTGVLLIPLVIYLTLWRYKRKVRSVALT